jgi:DNA-binding NtrC family response regulator
MDDLMSRFRLSTIEAAFHLHERVIGEMVPFSDGPIALSSSIPLHCTLGLLHAAERQDRAHYWFGRARRFARAIGSVEIDADVRETIRGSGGKFETDSLPPPDLDSAVTLLDLAGHPHVLGREALAVIEGAACAEAVALVATDGKSTRVIEQRAWSDRDAAVAAETRPPGIEVLPVGHYRDEMWQIVARPKAAIDPYCTFAAIRKLLATAVALDQYRRDEKQRAALWPADALEGDPDSIWASEQMAETLSIARRIAPNPISVLLTGETGTGKEMLARAIHRASDRADKPFLPFNCTAVPREMLESQLFGYKKGAFTGADVAFGGVIRAAAGGTLFLDEIADVSLDVQPKLLRFLETREIHPLGEPHPILVDVRIVAATNAALEKLVPEGRFREDLFYRLNAVHLKLPPLRERREEIPPLVHHYLRRYGDEQRKGRLTLSDEALEYLLLFSWPGNIRQLANEVRRIVAMVDPDTTITPAMLSTEIQASRRTIAAPAATQEELRLALDQPLPAAVQLLEQVMVRRALDRSHGRVEEASRILGISRKGLFLKRRRLGFRTAS